ncbi:MAG: hypothetical protein AB1505_16290 [Candidatus Latescibacterota bacterium]
MAIPIALLVDDPAPLINVYWWHAARRCGPNPPAQLSGEPVAAKVPLSFLDEYIAVLQRWGVRGKFTVLPYPAGLGPIDEGWPGCDGVALAAWLERVRLHVAPHMDITPEILTHARAVDLESMTLREQNEREWAQGQTAATLTPYIALALEILERVGLPARGVTSPWDFGAQVEDQYRTAIRRAVAQVTGRTQTWYFLHTDAVSTRLRSEVVWRDGGGWLVSLWAQVHDHLWDTMETRDDSPAYVSALADAFVTEDGTSGRLVQLFAADTPMVLVTHWQSLFSNGRGTGLRALDEVCRRVARVWGPAVEWTTCSDLAAAIAAGRWDGGQAAR